MTERVLKARADDTRVKMSGRERGWASENFYNSIIVEDVESIFKLSISE